MKKKEIKDFEMALEYRRKYWNCQEKLTFFIIVTLLLIAVGVIGIILSNAPSQEPEFKIEKNECWNEPSKNIIVEIDSFCEHVAKDSQSYEIDNYKTIKDSCKDNFYVLVKELDYLQIIIEYPFELIVETKKVCKQVEVVGMYFLGRYINNSQKCGELEVAERWNESTIRCMKRISKQDLTIEWLDENCECLELTCKKGDYHALDDLCIGESGKRYKPNNCEKYKCGEYQVEVIK